MGLAFSYNRTAFQMPTFRDYMESALYAPLKGFYATRTARADFYTAPELHPAFAEVLAAEICARLAEVAARSPKEPLYIVEVGSGDGTLARQVLGALRDAHSGWLSRTRYVLVERVETLLLESMLSLNRLGERVMGYSRLADVPELSGVVFSNELIDALPVHLLEKRRGRMGEVYVEPGAGGLPSARVGALSRRELSRAAGAVARSLPEGGRHAVNLELGAWLREVSRLLKSGFVVTVDYGREFDAASPNPPRSYRRHQTGPEVIGREGSMDLTASADFSALMREGEALGLRTREYATLSRFLIDRGILGRLPTGQSAQDYQERNRIKTLFHPEGMGESFKVLVQEKA